MKINKTLVDLRKNKGWSQAELADRAGVSQVMIGKYERGDAIPSFEVAKKMADAFDVSLDFLVGEGQNVHFDKKILNRIQDIQQMDADNQSFLFKVIDTFLRDYKTQQAYSQ